MLTENCKSVLLLPALLLTLACDPGTVGRADDGAAARGASSAAGRTPELPTPTGLRIYQAMLRWQHEQIGHPDYPRPAMCAANLSRVLRMAGIQQYNSWLVDGVIKKIQADGGEVVSLPRSRQGIVSALNARYGGRIPVGTVVGGCLRTDCSGSAGDGHVALVGDVDASGTVWVYHNNWYRPDNNGGTWAPHMVSKDHYYNLGLRRQWMATPWLEIQRDGAGRVVDVRSALPAIDDLDPLQYHVRLAVMRPIHQEASAAAKPTAPLPPKAPAPSGQACAAHTSSAADHAPVQIAAAGLPQGTPSWRSRPTIPPHYFVSFKGTPGKPATHEGLDAIIGETGPAQVTVGAVAAGTVAYVRLGCKQACAADPTGSFCSNTANRACGAGWGNHVVLDHGKGVYTRYAHLAPGSVKARVGHRVKRGQPLGLMGNTGRSGLRHLHLELGTRKAALDPCAGSQSFDRIYAPSLLKLY